MKKSRLTSLEIRQLFSCESRNSVAKSLPREGRGAKGPVLTGFFDRRLYSITTNSSIWKSICYVFTVKTFANMLILHLLFLAARFLSIKIVSQKPGNRSAFMSCMDCRNESQIETHYDSWPPPKIKGGGQAP